MKIDIDKLENARVRGGKIEARCPACAEHGGDETGNHFFILDGGDGKWGCVVNPGPHGKEHRRRIWELVGQVERDEPRPPRPPSPRPACRPARPLPPLRTPTPAELDSLVTSRGWPTSQGMEVLVERGQLFTGEIFDGGSTWPAWICTDPTRINVQARRMDGEKWTGIDAKAKSLPGTTAKRVIGASLIGTRPNVWLMEGTPDLCAAPIVAKLAGLDLDQIAFACITGAGTDIHADDLTHFSGKVVTIAMHDDAGHGKGVEAARRWARQLYLAGAAQVRGFDFGGSGGKDLADYLRKLATPLPPKPGAVATSAAPCPSPLPQADGIGANTDITASAPHSAPERAPLVPLEAPWIDGARYRLAGVHEVKNRLPLFILDAAGDTRRAFGCLIYDPLPHGGANIGHDSSGRRNTISENEND